MKLVQKLKRLYRYFFKNPPKFKITLKANIERHGNEYGGWNIIKDSINKDSIVYSIGIGEDISFDISLMEKYNCKIFAYDPTPRVIDWLEGQELSKNFMFYPTALGVEDGEITFFLPENQEHVSHKAFGETENSITVPCKKLDSLMNYNKHKHIDILKMDIEGFEYSVIPYILEKNVPVKQFLIEFHHFFPEVGNKKTEESISLLEKNGYRLFSVSDSFCEFHFVR